MTSAEIVRLRLLAVSAVTALVGTRVYTLALPQSPTLPAIRVQQISGVEGGHFRGGLNHFDDRVQVDIIETFTSGSYDSAEAIDQAIMGDRAGSAIAFWSGSIGTSPDDVVISVISPETQAHPTVDTLEPKQLRFSRDFMVRYRLAA